MATTQKGLSGSREPVTRVSLPIKGTFGGLGTVVTLGAFALVFGFLTISSSIQQSPTIDEPVHLLAGYSYLKWGDYRINPEHPPLVKAWAALPLLWLKITDPRASTPLWSQIRETEPGGPVYPLAQQMFFKWNDAATVFFYAKLQMLVASVVLAIFIFIWSRELFGIKAAMVALTLYGLDPNILAHSTIVHTDLPFAALVFIGVYFFCRALNELTWRNLSLASLSLGLAAITKHSFVAILPIWLILGLINVLRPEPHAVALLAANRSAANRKQKLVVLGGIFGSAAVAAYFCIWSAYGFRFNAVPDDAPLFLTEGPSQKNAIVQSLLLFVLDHHIFPEALVSGYLYNLKIWQHSAYLLGEVSRDGFWSYFPIAFAVKTPFPTVLLFGVSLGMCAVKKKWRAQHQLLIPILIYFAVAILSRFNIGIRHLLAIYPFLFVLIGGVVAELWNGGSAIKRGGMAILGLWSLWSAVSSYPHYLAYFNELAGGPKNGHKVLLDSNLDWGQDLKGLKKWLDKNGVSTVQLIYFGTADGKYYGIDDFYSTENLAALNSSPGREVKLPEYLVMSANFLFGGKIFFPEELEKQFAAYKLRQPVASVGHSLLVYKLDLADSKVYEDAAVITARKGMLNLATYLIGKALELEPTSATAWSQSGDLMVRQGKLDDALSQYREVVKLKPDLAEGYFNLGRILAAQGRLDEATENFRQALRAKPAYADAHQALGRALAQRGKVEEARRHYQEALSILKGSGG